MKTTKEVLSFARFVAEESYKDGCLYSISCDYISKNVITRAINELHKIARYTIEDFNLGIKTERDVELIKKMQLILTIAQKEIKLR